MKELLLKLVASDRKHLDGALLFLRLFIGFVFLALRQHFGKLSCTGNDGYYIIIPFLGPEGVVLQESRIAADGSKGGLELMGNIRDKVRMQCFRTIQLLYHHIKIV